MNLLDLLQSMRSGRILGFGDSKLKLKFIPVQNQDF